VCQYLSSHQTRLIYDSFGVEGLLLYERHAEEFREFVDKLGETDVSQSEKKNLETQILFRCHLLIEAE
jgi:hypothetical protein